MVATPADLETLSRVDRNREVLAAIAGGAEPSRDGRGPWSPDGWVMRTHPDLAEALAAAAVDAGLLPQIAYGIDVLVDHGQRILAVAWGTSRVWLSIDDGPAFTRSLESGAVALDEVSGWVAVDAWQVDLPAWVKATAILASGGGRA